MTSGKFTTRSPSASAARVAPTPGFACTITPSRPSCWPDPQSDCQQGIVMRTDWIRLTRVSREGEALRPLDAIVLPALSLARCITRTARSEFRCERKPPARTCQRHRAYKSAGSRRRHGTHDGLPSPPSAHGLAIQAGEARHWRPAASWPLLAGSCRTGRNERGAASP